MSLAHPPAGVTAMRGVGDWLRGDYDSVDTSLLAVPPGIIEPAQILRAVTAAALDINAIPDTHWLKVADLGRTAETALVPFLAGQPSSCASCSADLNRWMICAVAELWRHLHRDDASDRWHQLYNGLLSSAGIAPLVAAAVRPVAVPHTVPDMRP